MKRLALAAAVLVAGISCHGAALADPTVPPRPATAASSGAALDPATEAKLADVDARAGQIRDYAARFEQRKYTALLRKPLVSTGRVRSVGAVVRWDTETPEPSVLFVEGAEVRTYYPKQKLEERFPLDRRMADLVASPVPRLATLRQGFAFAALDPAAVRKEVADLPPAGDEVAVRLLPTSDFFAAARAGGPRVAGREIGPYALRRDARCRRRPNGGQGDRPPRPMPDSLRRTSR